jgi:hypothetical protein
LYALRHIKDTGTSIDTTATIQIAANSTESSSSSAWFHHVVMMYIATGLVLTSTFVQDHEHDGSNSMISMTQCESFSHFETNDSTITKKKSVSSPNQDEKSSVNDDTNVDIVTVTCMEQKNIIKERRKTYFDEDYEATNVVGAGSFGVVMQGIDKKDGHLVAVKMIQDLYDNVEEVQREKEALRQLQLTGGHENIITYKSAYHHDGFHYIVTEFVPGESLYSLLTKTKRLPQPIALNIMKQLASAVSFLKQNELVHRDLKPENIMIVKDPLITERFQVKLIDFGSAGIINNTMNQQKQDQQKMLSGTRCYWPPEALLKGETTYATDMWSLGCILYILLSGQHPFDLSGHSSEEEIIQRICTSQVSFEDPIWTRYDPGMKELVSGLLEKNPHKRITVEKLMDHPMLQVCDI